MIPLTFIVGGNLDFVDFPVIFGRLHPLESLVPLSSDVLCSYVGPEVDHDDLEGSGQVFFCGPFGWSYTKAGVLGSMGQGLKAVVLGPAVEQVSSSLGLGESLILSGILMNFLSSVGEAILSTSGPSITSGGILVGPVLFSAGLSGVVLIVRSGVGLLVWGGGGGGGGGLVLPFFFFLWMVMKPSSSLDESAALGLLVGVEVIPSASLWVGTGSSLSLAVGVSANSSRCP